MSEEEEGEEEEVEYWDTPADDYSGEVHSVNSLVVPPAGGADKDAL